MAGAQNRNKRKNKDTNLIRAGAARWRAAAAIHGPCAGNGARGAAVLRLMGRWVEDAPLQCVLRLLLRLFLLRTATDGQAAPVERHLRAMVCVCVCVVVLVVVNTYVRACINKDTHYLKHRHILPETQTHIT
jgi:hypothetical protein